MCVIERSPFILLVIRFFSFFFHKLWERIIFLFVINGICDRLEIEWLARVSSLLISWYASVYGHCHESICLSHYIHVSNSDRGPYISFFFYFLKHFSLFVMCWLSRNEWPMKCEILFLPIVSIYWKETFEP